MKKLLYFLTFRWWKLFESDQISPILRYSVYGNWELPEEWMKYASYVGHESYLSALTSTKEQAEQLKKFLKKTLPNVDVDVAPLDQDEVQLRFKGSTWYLSHVQWCPTCEKITSNLFFKDSDEVGCRKCHTSTESLKGLSDKEVIKRVKQTEEGASSARTWQLDELNDFDSSTSVKLRR